MRVVLVHYHLRRGGVTRVMARAAEALRGEGVEVVVLTGEAPPLEVADSFGGTPVRVVDGLGYRDGGSREDAETLVGQLRSAAGGAGEVIWHFHNHSLGKNAALTRAVGLLAAEGYRLVLQPHDFAEDGRPGNYARLEEAMAVDGAGWQDVIYPASSKVTYAVLTRRDASVLEGAGAAPGQVHVLANPLPLALGQAERNEVDPGLVLYPTRGIRRKNLGEFCFLAAVDPRQRRWVTTLGPENPEWQPVHDAWVGFAAERRLRLDLAAVDGGREDFLDLVARAGCCVTTSVAEGFGYAFLEPYAWGTGLLGRDLPEITADFKEAGMDLRPTYARLDVPLDWVGRDRLATALRAGLGASWECYGRALYDAAVDRAFDAVVVDGMVDFGKLDEAMQRVVIERCLDDPAAAGQCALPNWEPAGGEIVRRNRDVIRQRYGMKAYARQLMELYAGGPDSGGRGGHLDGKAVLDAFLAPERFVLLRS